MFSCSWQLLRLLTDADIKHGSPDGKRERVHLSRCGDLFCYCGGGGLQDAPSLRLDLLQRPVVVGSLDAEVLADAVSDLLLLPVGMQSTHDGYHLGDLVPLQCGGGSRWSMSR